MIRGVNCMKCGKLLFEVVPLPPNGKDWAMHEKTPLVLKSDSVDYYYECPHCRAKNVVIEEHPLDGPLDIASKQEMTVGKNQEIYIYEYVEAKNIDYYFGTGALGGKVGVKKNTLMIWIDKDTGIVQDYGYKKEIE